MTQKAHAGAYTWRNHNSKRSMHPNAHCILTGARTWKPPKYPLTGRDKEGTAHTYNGILCSCKKGMKWGHFQRSGWTERLSYRVE